MTQNKNIKSSGMSTFRRIFQFSKQEVSQAFDNAKMFKRARGYTLLLAPASESQQHGKILIIISRKASLKAHERNLLRRRLKAYFYEQKLHKSTPGTFILIVRKAFINATIKDFSGLFAS